MVAIVVAGGVCLFGLSLFDCHLAVLAFSGYALTYIIPSARHAKLQLRDDMCFLSKEMKQHNVAYWAWTWVFHHHTDLCIVLQSILNLPVSVRKELLGLCRTQSPPIPGSFLRSSMQHLDYCCMIPSAPSRELDLTDYVSMPLIEFINQYSHLFVAHLTASVISHGIRIAPNIDPNEYNILYLGAVSKEINSAVNLFIHASLDFRCIFSACATDRSLPISERLPPSEEVASDTYMKFCGLKSKLSGRIFYPRGGSKTVGNTVAKSFWDSYYSSGMTFKHDGTLESNSDQVTVDDCLNLYERTGGYVDGPVEVRSSWKYSQLSPRVYYARGGDVQVPAQYLQEVVNIIIDEFPEVHRINRFAPPSSLLADNDVELIYDYTSFTSNLDALIPFIDCLSDFFAGVFVFVIDPVNGIVPMDLGFLFAEYNRVCNQYADFDITRLSVVGSEDSILQHTCGMLGIEGNIFLATLLHGLYLRFLAGLDRSKCVGDDARFHHKTQDGRMSESDKEYAHWALSGIGLLNFDKMTIFSARVDPAIEAFRYIKRPLHRDIDIMIEGILLTLPSQIPLCGALDSFHTVIPTKAHPCRNVFKQIIRFLDQLFVHSVTISEDRDHYTYCIVYHLSYLQRIMRERDPTGEFSDIGRSNLKSFYRLPPVAIWGTRRYIDWFVGEIDFYEKVRFPKYGGADNQECDGRIGSVMCRNQSKGRSFLKRMGYLQSEILFEEFSYMEIGEDMFKFLLAGSYAPVVKYDVIRNIPSWYAQVPGAL